METKISVRRMQVLRILVAAALAGGVLSTIIFFWKAGKIAGIPFEFLKSLPENMEQSLSGFSFTRSEGGRVVFSINSNKTVSYGNSSATVLEGVVAEVFGRQGNRRDSIRTERCEYDKDSGDFFVPGNVSIELGSSGINSEDPGNMRLEIETSKLRFHQSSSTATSWQPVAFRYGPLKGQGNGLRYSAKEELVEIEKDVRLILEAPKKSGKPSFQFTASRMEVDKDAGSIRLFPPVMGSRGSQQLTAKLATLYLGGQGHIRQVVLEDDVEVEDKTEDRSLSLLSDLVTAWFDPESFELLSIEAEKGSKVQIKEGRSSSLLDAQEIKAFFGVNELMVREIVATGDAQLRSDSIPNVHSHARSNATTMNGNALNNEMYILRAPEVRLTLRPGTRSIDQLSTKGSARLDIVSQDERGGRKQITADQFFAHFDERGRIKKFEGYPHARLEMHEESPVDSEPANVRRSESDQVTGFFNSSDGSLVRLEQVGHFRYFEGDRRGRAERGDYSAANQEFVLSGDPVLWDSTSRVTAKKIIFNEFTKTARAAGSVRGTHLGDLRLKDSHLGEYHELIPSNVIADSAILWGEAQNIRYEGGVRAWKGQDVITSSILQVFLAERKVEAKGNVSTSYAQRISDNNPTERSFPVSISSNSLIYIGKEGRATYLGTVTLRAGETKIQSDRMDVLFSIQNGAIAQVKEATGEGKVVVVQPGRRAEGERMTYLSEKGEIILEGGPPIAFDQHGDSTTGERLTFSITGDSIGVHGGENSPTVTRRRRMR